MKSAGPSDADVLATPAGLLRELRESRAAADAAEVRVLELAIAWADAHPGREVGVCSPRIAAALSGRVSAALDPFAPGGPDGVDDVLAEGLVDTDDVEWRGVPSVAWDAPASFAAANRMTTPSGRALIRDALVLRHRLPRLWACVRAVGSPGWVPVWRARTVAQAVLGRPDDVCAALDEAVVERAGRVGARALARLVDEAMTRLYPEQQELERLEALDACHATLHLETINHTGVVEMSLRGEVADLAAFDETLSEVAAALAAQDDAAGRGAESLDVRRARAVGLLADPAAALALLGGDVAWADRCRRRRVELVVHLSADAVAGRDPAAFDRTGRALLADQVRDWCGAPGSRITVHPVLDLAADLARSGGCGEVDLRHARFADGLTSTGGAAMSCSGELRASRADTTPAPLTAPDAPVAATLLPSGTSPQADAASSYRPTADQVRQIRFRDRSCVFPWCTRPADRCDLDHIEPFDDADPGAGGATRTHNLAPLCRHHHRLKTHAGWRYHRLRGPDRAPPTYLWADRHGQTFTVTDQTTTDTTRPAVAPSAADPGACA